MTRLNYSERVVRLAKSLWKDTSGIMLPYVTIMLVAFFGLGLLAVDGSRYMSLQTQMQAAADGLALAGAAELNKKSGAIANARSAMASFVDNRLSGMAFTAKLGYSATFYQNLPAANTLPSSGTVATTDANAHFVLVTVTPVTVPTIFSVTYLNPLESNNFTAGDRRSPGMVRRAFAAFRQSTSAILGKVRAQV